MAILVPTFSQKKRSMKKFFGMVMFLVVMTVALAAAGLMFMDSPQKTLQSLVIRHADKLPLEYFGGRLFDQHCANCHDNPAMHAPTRAALSGFSKESIIVAMEFGKMQPMAAHLRQQERFLIATYLAGSALNTYDWIEILSSNTIDGPNGYPANGEEWTLALFSSDTSWITDGSLIPDDLPADYTPILVGQEFDENENVIGVVFVDISSISITAVPEPSSTALLGLGGLGLLLRRRR